MRGIHKIWMALLASGVLISAIVAGDVAVRAEVGSAETERASGPDSANCPVTWSGRGERQASRKRTGEDREQDALYYKAQRAVQELNRVLSGNPAVEAVYGGRYIGPGEHEGDDKVLVVVLTTDSEEIKEVIQKGTPSQEVRFQKGKYTLAELQEVVDQISDAFQKSPVASQWKIFGVGVYESENVVKVSLPDLAYVDWFKREICDADCIVFEKGQITVPAVGKLGVPVGAVRSVNRIRYVVKKSAFPSRAGEVEVKGIDGKSRKSVVIPAAIKWKGQSYKVVGVGKNAFKGMKKLKNVTIGKNVRKIDRRAFKNCRKLKTVKILSKKCSYSVKSIRKGASKKVVIKMPKGSGKK